MDAMTLDFELGNITSTHCHCHFIEHVASERRASVEPMPLPAEVRHIMLTVSDGGSFLLWEH
jgi:hypothetical protein